MNLFTDCDILWEPVTDPYHSKRELAVTFKLSSNMQYHAILEVSTNLIHETEYLKKAIINQVSDMLAKEMDDSVTKALKTLFTEAMTNKALKTLFTEAMTNKPVTKSEFDINPYAKYKPAEDQSLGPTWKDIFKYYDTKYYDASDSVVPATTATESNYADMLEIARATFPGLSETSPPCPAASEHGCTYGFSSLVDLANMIIHLNDNHEYPREKVAEWLDTLDIDLSIPIPQEEVNADTC